MRDDGQSGSDLAGPMVVGDDHLEPAARASAISSTAVMPQSTVRTRRTLLRQARERLPGDAVALLEAAREMPLDLGAEVAQAVTASAVAQIPSTS